VLFQAIHLVAPDVEVASLDEDTPLREQAGLDEFDVAELAALLSDAVHHQIPVADYQQLSTIRAGLAYLAPQLP
jgi:acyl carrier protein